MRTQRVVIVDGIRKVEIVSYFLWQWDKLISLLKTSFLV